MRTKPCSSCFRRITRPLKSALSELTPVEMGSQATQHSSQSASEDPPANSARVLWRTWEPILHSIAVRSTKLSSCFSTMTRTRRRPTQHPRISTSMILTTRHRRSITSRASRFADRMKHPGQTQSTKSAVSYTRSSTSTTWESFTCACASTGWQPSTSQSR